MHQYVPVDVLPWIGRFLDHWRPELAVFTESEIWPAMLSEVHGRGIPLMLINARISERSFQRWRRMRGLARTLLGSFDAILAQDDLARAQLLRLGADPARIRVTGSLKEGAAPLPDDEKERALIAEGFSARPLWLAASTHDGEEEAAMAAHLAVRRGMPRLALILAPRHPERGDAVAKLVREAGLSVAQRTKAEPIRDDTDVYLADTLGEMGLWYRMAPVSFVGGSLVPVGGHNPFEPALLGSAVLYGPHVRNFRDAYSRLASAGAAREVRDADELGAALGETLRPERAAEMAAAGWEVVSESASVTDTVLARICGYLDCAA